MKSLLIALVSILVLVSCAEQEPQTPVQDPQWSQEESINMNSTFAAEEDEEIENFLSHRPDWSMTKTGTGLRYFIYEESEEKDSAKVGDMVTVDFEISLLDGTICYTSEEKGPESFVVEKTDIESGLHEGVKYMTIGSKAKFILPSHMAHGLIGDTDKIPPLTPAIYDIHLLRIDKPQVQ